MNYLRYYLGATIVITGIVGFILGGTYVWLGLLTFVPMLIIDAIAPVDHKQHDASIEWLVEFPLYLQLFLMLGIYGSFTYWMVLEQQSVQTTPMILLLGAAFSLGWLSAVPTLPVNQELMQRRNPIGRLFAALLGTIYFDPKRDVAHVHTHHIHLGAAKNSDTCPRGYSVYRFIPVTIFGSLKDFFEMEAMRCKKTGRSLFAPTGRVMNAIMQIAILVGIIFWFAGLKAILVALAGMLIGRMLIEAFNYYQHYGLVRVEG